MIADHLSIPVLESRTRFLNSELFKKLQHLPQLSWKLRPLYRYLVRRHARCVLMWQALCISKEKRTGELFFAGLHFDNTVLLQGIDT